MSQIKGVTTIAEEPGATIMQDVYGLDVLTRQYSGPLSDWLRFAGVWRGGVADSTYKDYYLTNRSAGIHRGEVIRPVLTFKGVPGLSTGKFAVSRAKRTKALVEETITLKLADGSGRSVEITYLAPVTTWKYATGYEPTDSLHKGAMAQFDDAYKVVKARGATQFPISFVTGPSVNFNPILQYLVYKRVDCTWNAEQEGRAWTVTENNRGRMVGVEDATQRTEKTVVTRNPLPPGTTGE